MGRTVVFSDAHKKTMRLTWLRWEYSVEMSLSWASPPAVVSEVEVLDLRLVPSLRLNLSFLL